MSKAKPLNWALDILGKRWTVKWTKPSKEDYGHCDHGKCEIAVDPSCSLEQQKDTLLHEILHGVSEELCLRLSERQVRLTATALVQVLRANPEAVAWMILQDE